MEPVISIKNLRKSYGSRQVLKGIDLDVYAGQVLGYIGPNGAGKSTTVKILCGLLDDYEGEVQVKGLDLKSDALAVKAMIGYVPELAELYDVLTPMEFLKLMGSLYNLDEIVCVNRIERMMTAFGLQQQLNQRMDTFSKGMKQKVLIASGLLHNPDIIILDEPLSGLDANSVIIIKDLINKLAKEGKTIFYCSHMMDIVEKVSDRIILINEGVIVADGSFEQLKQQEGNNSLEQIFAQLTGNTSGVQVAEDLLRAFDK
ncbi:ABC transporter ATP-binding protein [Parafilimonas terrae]|jgi:ABC-2 type transport system ATP-binding protein|uniref:ABC-2 type transport system ATP-binding protein n=1 Tax=Parafilimonas terrae TaxID=1465490 RepID=A0A1I5RL40_9BACT|nr:ABC transporter ATP-binding protein [Parafilimonas terrae]SFP59259.1 ABC-2 type transport system ATP-binding protein [Parafilimonas terrae]